MTTTKPYTSGATRAAHRLSEKLAADLKRLGPLRGTLGRQQVRREQRKATKVAAGRDRNGLKPHQRIKRVRIVGDDRIK